MVIEEYLSELNANIFLREFSFSKNTFHPIPGSEIEFADHVIWIDDLLIVFQLKERVEPEDTTLDREIKWYEKKIIGLATKQIRDTLKYLENQENITITNQRGHTFSLKYNSIKEILKIIVYAPGKLLPDKYWNKKFHNSSSIGFIHIIPIHDYLGICKTLITPTEIREYLIFREKIIKEWKDVVENVKEPAMVGQFLFGEFNSQPNNIFIKYFEAFLDNTHEFDIMFLLQNFYDHIDLEKSQLSEKGYYKLLLEFAKLIRIELKEVKLRISLSMDACNTDKISLPYRMIIPRTGCGFVFIPIPIGYSNDRFVALKNFTYLAKYDQKVDRCIGITFAKDCNSFLLDWALLDYPWKEEPETDFLLSKGYPFRNLKEEIVPRYYFYSDL